MSSAVLSWWNGGTGTPALANVERWTNLSRNRSMVAGSWPGRPCSAANTAVRSTRSSLNVSAPATWCRSACSLAAASIPSLVGATTVASSPSASASESDRSSRMSWLVTTATWTAGSVIATSGRTVSAIRIPRVPTKSTSCGDM